MPLELQIRAAVFGGPLAVFIGATILPVGWNIIYALLVTSMLAYCVFRRTTPRPD